MTTPEKLARERIDQLLKSAGWQVQPRNRVNPRAAKGVAWEEAPLATGPGDYLLLADRLAAGVIEAKALGVTLSGVELQSRRYSTGMPNNISAHQLPLPVLYESNGAEIYFTDVRDPEPRSRRLFAFHKPETIADWMGEPDTFRARLRTMPPLDTKGLWGAQIEAIQNLEASLAADKPRALIQMATGSGKTFTAVSFIYRLIRYAKARRILFLVDRGNLGKQALKEFQQFVTPDDGRKFTELYNVQHMTTNRVDPVAKVCICTVQRLYSMLSGEEEYDAGNEEILQWENFETTADPKTVFYNPKLPIEHFDVVVIDECHRSIYNLWRQVLEYFDAYLIGLTATPSAQTLGFFNRNLVMEYTRDRAVADGVNVDGEVYRIRTRITEEGSTVDTGFNLKRRDRQTRAERWQVLDEPLEYSGSQLNQDIVAPDQIRTIIRTFRDKVLTEMFPERTVVPKTLIFAKDDSHAEDIVRIVREEFGKSNDFCRKITYRVTDKSPDDLIRDLRTNFDPRIAVTVDMIATGTDVKPLEILLFMRQVKSALLFEQMIGRGTRVINPTDLQGVSGVEARSKDRFVIVDAVGVMDSPKVQPVQLERKRTVAFDKLMEQVALGADDDDTLTTLAGRLARLARRRPLSSADEYTLNALAQVASLSALSNQLLDAIDPDKIRARAEADAGTPTPSESDMEAAAFALRDAATAPFADPDLRDFLNDLQRDSEQVIDEVSIDVLKEAGFSMEATEKARQTVDAFRTFIEANRDQIDALQILYAQPYAHQRVTLEQLKRLADEIAKPPYRWTPEALWQAYERLEQGKVRGTAQRRLTDLIALVRHAVQPDGDLVAFPAQVQERYSAWLAQQESAGRTFTPDQQRWLDKIAAQVGVDLEIQPTDLDDIFADEGGRLGARRVLGDNWRDVVTELNQVLAA
jgi:type I restriction enzyme R subunit